MLFAQILQRMACLQGVQTKEGAASAQVRDVVDQTSSDSALGEL